MKIILNKEKSKIYNFDYTNINSNLAFDITIGKEKLIESFFIYRSGLSLKYFEEMLNQGSNFAIDLVGSLTIQFIAKDNFEWCVRIEMRDGSVAEELLSKDVIIKMINEYWESIANEYKINVSKLIEMQENYFHRDR